MPAAVRAGKERDCPLRTSTLCSENWASGGALGLAPEISNLLGTKTFLLQDALQHLPAMTLYGVERYVHGRGVREENLRVLPYR